VRLNHLSLTNFRNYARLELDLPGAMVVLQGANAQGKTNLLEAVYLLATSRSPTAGADRELIHWLVENDIQPYARVEAQIERGGESHRLEVTTFRAEADNGHGNPLLRKRIRVDGAPRRALDLLGQLNVVLFLPQDVELVAGSPSHRRRYLDVTLCQIDPRYCRALQEYNRVVTQRNHLLRLLRDRRTDADQLHFWDAKLVECGAEILHRRLAATAELDAAARTIHADLSGGSEHLVLSYVSSVVAPCGEGDARTSSMELNALSTALRERMKEVRLQEAAQGVSLVGPHRDDLRFEVNGRDMRVYGSRGQQRTAALALKLAEVRMMRHATGEGPVLLLDDVLSELDARRRDYLMASIESVQQAVMTTTDLGFLSPSVLERATLLQVTEGRVSAIPKGTLPA
jgi:DNA replication and repair protein RecF